MQWESTRARLRFLAHALEGSGGFAPKTQAVWDGNKSVQNVWGECELVPYTRESAQKFAARAQIAVYENHLRTACERFVGFLGRKRPKRVGAESVFAKALIENADLRGTHLDDWLLNLALHVRARGCMLVLMQMPPGEPSTSLQQQIERRAVPYLSEVRPEDVISFEQDRAGLLTRCAIATEEVVNGKLAAVTHEWDAAQLQVFKGRTLVRALPHPFGVCPVLSVTESGQPLPQLGKYAQIADLSRRYFNARSELDEILRSQTFSLLTYQVPPEANAAFSAAEAAATIGTHSMLVHNGDTPAFIAPDAGPATTYLAVLAQLQETILRISMEQSTEASTQAESGVSRRLRFESLNSDLSTFARQLQALELRLWALFSRGLGVQVAVNSAWATDYNLGDPLAELEILAAMQATGMPEAVLNAERSAIVALVFDNASDQLKAELQASIDEAAQAAAQAGAAQDDPNAEP